MKLHCVSGMTSSLNSVMEDGRGARKLQLILQTHTAQSGSCQKRDCARMEIEHTVDATQGSIPFHAGNRSIENPETSSTQFTRTRHAWYLKSYARKENANHADSIFNFPTDTLSRPLRPIASQEPRHLHACQLGSETPIEQQ